MADEQKAEQKDPRARGGAAAAQERAQAQAAEAKGSESPQDESASDMPRTAAERVDAMDDPNDPTAPEILYPYPEYESMGLDGLKGLADERGVQINPAALRGHLIFRLRAAQHSPAYDLMNMDQLNAKASELGVEPDPEFLTAHLVSELRAADSMGR